MSIILKGIDIPKEGEWLEIIIKPTKEIIIDTIRYSDNALLKTEYDSVIQIPKDHGNIIDESKAVVIETIDGYYEITAPTILEEEK